jgi:hypothetical protein
VSRPRAIWALAAALTLVACSGTTPTSPDPSTHPNASKSSPSSAAKPKASPLKTIKDPKVDLTDADGNKVGRHPDIDIVSLAAQAVGDQLYVDLQVAGDVPKTYSTTKAEVDYLVVVEADGSGKGDYWLKLTNNKAGSWAPELSDWVTTSAYEGADFPGVGKVAKTHITFRVKLSSLGSPKHLRLSAITQRINHATGEVTAQDQAPAGELYAPTNRWLTIDLPSG